MSDEAGVARKAYEVKKGLMGMTEGEYQWNTKKESPRRIKYISYDSSLSCRANSFSLTFRVLDEFLMYFLGRVTFFITADGIVKEAYTSVINFNEHAKFVRKILEAEEKNNKEENAEQAQAASGANADESGVQTEGAVAGN